MGLPFVAVGVVRVGLEYGVAMFDATGLNKPRRLSRGSRRTASNAGKSRKPIARLFAPDERFVFFLFLSRSQPAAKRRIARKNETQFPHGASPPASTARTFAARRHSLIPSPNSFLRAMSRDKSLAAFARAQRLMPGGVNSPARAFGGVGSSPLAFRMRRRGRTCAISMATATPSSYRLWGPADSRARAHPPGRRGQARSSFERTAPAPAAGPTGGRKRLARLLSRPLPSISCVCGWSVPAPAASR